MLEMKILLSSQLHLSIEQVVLCSFGQYYILSFLPAASFGKLAAFQLAQVLVLL